MVAISTDRMISGPLSDAVEGQVRWVPTKSLWTLMMLFAALILGPITFTWTAFAVFIVTSAITICGGHSVGMHRLLIHQSFVAPKWLERLLVYLGTLVGMAGPFGMIAAHDIRDWAQRQSECHDLYAHRRGFFQDCWWQMHSALTLRHPPVFVIEERVRSDRFFQFVEKTWMLQQLPLALVLYALGGWGFVVWGIAVRVTVSLHGHWLVGHFAHRRGRQNWSVDGVAVQGFNIPNVSFLTFGESHHGNHHAYPGSARLSQAKGELDPGWWLICVLRKLGLVWGVKLPEQVGDRFGLRRLGNANRHHPKKLSLLSAWVAASLVGTVEFWTISGFRPEVAPSWKSMSEFAQLFVSVGGYAAVFLIIVGIPLIRFRTNSAEADAIFGFKNYLKTSVFAAFLCSFVFFWFSPLMLLLFVSFATPPLGAGLAFAYFNKRATRKHLLLVASQTGALQGLHNICDAAI